MSHITKMLSERQIKTVKEYKREFQRIGEPENCGYSFPCHADGSLDTEDQFYDCWKDNYDYCLANPDKYEDRGVIENSWTYCEPAVGQCSCGCEVILSRDVSCNGCGQWYNAFGQALVDPKYWEEDYYYRDYDSLDYD